MVVVMFAAHWTRGNNFLLFEMWGTRLWHTQGDPRPQKCVESDRRRVDVAEAQKLI